MKYSGVDACPYGWLMISVIRDKAEFFIEKEFSTMINNHAFPARILVDMPIGLLSAGGPSQRPCDVMARKILGKKHSSIFSPPCVEALYESDYQSASHINYTITGKKLSKQSWNIVKRIREVNAFLHHNPPWRKWVLETHPEMAFQKLNNGQPLAFSKKTREGIRERLDILSRYFSEAEDFFNKMMNDSSLKKKARPDDMADAFVLAILNRVRKENLVGISSEPLTDPLGNTMEIWI